MLEQKMHEVWEAFKSDLSPQEYKLYLDFLIKKGLVSGESFEATKIFSERVKENLNRVLQEAKLEYLNKGKKKTLDKLLLKVALFQAFEILTGKKPPVDEEEFGQVNTKELGKLCKVLFFSFLLNIKKQKNLMERMLNEEVYNE